MSVQRARYYSLAALHKKKVIGPRGTDSTWTFGYVQLHVIRIEIMRCGLKMISKPK